MDTTSIRCLVNSISRFVHLVSCQTMIPVLIQKKYKNFAGVLKLLKPVLDDVIDFKLPPHENLLEECEQLDMSVNEAREFLENWSPKRSKICSVLQSELLLLKVRSTSLEISHMLYKLLQSSPSTSSLSSVQSCVQELESFKQERITENIQEALKNQSSDIVPCTDDLVRIIESLNLTSNEELLKESVAVEKERVNAQLNKVKGELDHINQIVDLISHIRDCMLKVEHFGVSRGVLIPPYFRCPLSLELMLDPVIVASGQTYEKSSIQKWLDHGLTICPRTRRTLTHTNLIPNYTVKAMIANWCEENNIRLPNNSEHTDFLGAQSPSVHLSTQNSFGRDSSHCSVNSSKSASKSSFEIGNGCGNQGAYVSSRFSGEESNGFQCRAIDNFDHPSPEQSYTHSRSESATSAISSVDFVPPASNEGPSAFTKLENVGELLGEITSASAATASSDRESEFSPWLSGRHVHGSKPKDEVSGNGIYIYKANSALLPDSGSNDLTTASHVKKLIEDLKCPSKEVQTTAAEELRFLAKHNKENRVIIGQCGAIAPLLSLLYSKEKLTQEHSVTALLNLSILEDNKAMIAEAGAIEPLIYVLKSGNDGAKENSAAALFSLSVLEEYKAKIGRSGAIKVLVDLLGSGTLRGKKDAATALFNLSIFHENKARIVQAGAVKYLVGLMDPATEMVDKALALLANLSTIGEGRTAIVRAGGIPLLVEVVESGSLRGKENAASVLLQLCLNSTKFCTLVLQEGAVPPLVALSQSGTPRAKEKAQQLLSHFRNQREGCVKKGKP